MPLLAQSYAKQCLPFDVVPGAASFRMSSSVMSALSSVVRRLIRLPPADNGGHSVPTGGDGIARPPPVQPPSPGSSYPLHRPAPDARLQFTSHQTKGFWLILHCS